MTRAAPSLRHGCQRPGRQMLEFVRLPSSEARKHVGGEVDAGDQSHDPELPRANQATQSNGWADPVNVQAGLALEWFPASFWDGER
jgi:hypothetical protein